MEYPKALFKGPDITIVKDDREEFDARKKGFKETPRTFVDEEAYQESTGSGTGGGDEPTDAAPGKVSPVDDEEIIKPPSAAKRAGTFEQKRKKF